MTDIVGHQIIPTSGEIGGWVDAYPDSISVAQEAYDKGEIELCQRRQKQVDGSIKVDLVAIERKQVERHRSPWFSDDALLMLTAASADRVAPNTETRVGP